MSGDVGLSHLVQNLIKLVRCHVEESVPYVELLAALAELESDVYVHGLEAGVSEFD